MMVKDPLWITSESEYLSYMKAVVALDLGAKLGAKVQTSSGLDGG